MDYKLLEINWDYTEPRLVATFRKVEVGQLVNIDGEKYRVTGFTSEPGWVGEWKAFMTEQQATAALEDGSVAVAGGTMLPFSPTPCNQFGNHTYAIGRLEQ